MVVAGQLVELDNPDMVAAGFEDVDAEPEEDRELELDSEEAIDDD